MFSCALSSGLLGGSGSIVMLAGSMSLSGCVPAGLVEQDDSVRTRHDVARNLVQMLLHGPTIGVRKDQRGTDVASRADGTEDIGIRVALISGLAWTAATLGPLIDKAVLLSNARLVLEPDLNRRSRPAPLLRQRFLHCLCEFFLNPQSPGATARDVVAVR